MRNVERPSAWVREAIEIGGVCGISGIIHRKNQPLDRSKIEAMIASQKHRGPNGHGFFEGPGFHFGHNRLSILDLTPAGHQPMSLATPGGQHLVITYNGEIYNYLELREELAKKGHTFQTETDTEVLMRAYQEWGPECLHRFNGMFAFVLYDSARQILFGARDRFGVKPLHLKVTSESLHFASEIKAILTVTPTPEPDRQTVVDFLYAGHLQHTGRTFYRGIDELKAGHMFTYSLRDHSLSISKWYSLSERVNSLEPTSLRLSADEASDRLRELLKDSIRLRLRSDVRVGTCLSGGIDSSTIASIAARLSDSRLPFIGITAESLDPSNDETEFARAVAENAKLEWHRVKPEDFRERLSAVVHAQDEPFATMSVFMQDAVMRKARALGVPVLLDGQGGDEVFLGYPKYLQARRWPPPPVTLAAKGLLSRFGFLEQREFDRSLSESSAHELSESQEHLLDYRRSLSTARDAQLMDILSTNLPQLLRYEDRNSMAHSIETRLPFLDYRVVEFGVSLPFNVKVTARGVLGPFGGGIAGGSVQKAVLRNAARKFVPSRILDRRDKIGFAAPDRLWHSYLGELWPTTVAQNPLLRELLPGLDLSSSDAVSPGSRWKLMSLSLWGSAG